jgi:bacterioferritin (cytochrome b1)
LSSKDNLIRLFKKQIQIENSIVNSVHAEISELKNPVIKGVLTSISLDSLKHADMYSAAIKLLTTVSQALTEENLDKQRQLIEKHIQIEEEIIKKLVEIIPTVHNEKIILLLNAILSDEKRHHRLLKKVLKILVTGETITDNQWWDIIWENVPFHGTPGG